MTKPIDLEKQARRPRLRTASVLFGVVAVSTSAGAATHYALCDRDGAPACGNIGQLGREAPPPPAPVAEAQPITNSTVTHNAPLVSVTISTKLVAPPAPPEPRDPGPDFVIHPTPTATPLADAKREYAVGNVMGKGGSRRRD